MKKSDQEILESIAKKDQTAFVEFYNRYIKIIYKYVLKRVKDQQVADDLVQDFWLKLWDNPSFLRCDDKNSAKVYLINNFRFRIFDFFQMQGTHSISIGDYNLTQEDFGWYNQICEAIEEQEIIEITKDALKDKTETMKNIFWMRVDNISPQETADQLNVSIRTVYNNYHESLSTVRDYFIERHPDIVSDIKCKAKTTSVNSAVGMLAALFSIWG